MLKLLIENNIPLFAAHTNMDTAKGGINDKLSEIFELTDVKILDQHTDDSSAGLGRYGRLEKRLNSVILQNIVKRYSAHLFCVFPAILKKNINTVAVASGSCSESIPLAYEKGADVIITGDMKYHNND